MSQSHAAPHNRSITRDLMKGLLAATVVLATFGMAAFWAAGLERWAAAEPAAAAPEPPAAPVLPRPHDGPAPLAQPPGPAEAIAITPTPPAEAAGADPLAPEEPTPTAEAKPQPEEESDGAAAASEYIVREGDTLSAIAAAHGLTAEELAAANGLEDPDTVWVGQVLRIPAGAVAVPTPTPTPAAEMAQPVFEPADPAAIGEPLWIDVDLSEQRLTAYEGQIPVRTTLVSTGLPDTPTPEGQFRIYVKFRYDDMAGPGYYIKDVPHVMYFYQGYGLHGVTWHGNFGHPMSRGCVNLPTAEAEWLFGWAEVGTLVNIHE